MIGREGERELRRRSAWRILLPVLVFILVVIASVASLQAYGPQGPAPIVFQGGVGILALWALYDGVARFLGRATFLGVGTGLDRFVGLFQAIGTFGLAMALLPNTIAFLNLVVEMTIGAG